jgi:isopentenyl diphosphate isomerase/L-lactate dehydrogenase-like FMN-dependent dehydrogenase
MGAHLASAAVPFLHAARLEDGALIDLITQWHRQLEVCCFITGSKNLEALKTAPLLRAPA